MFQLGKPQPWTVQALCKEVDPELFYAEKGEWATTFEAKKLCHRCPVRAQCLEFALETNEAFGVWGGLTAVQRRELRMQRGMPLPDRYVDDWHGKPGGYRRHYREKTNVCDRCRQVERLARSVRDGRCG